MSTSLGVLAVSNTSTYIQGGIDTWITDNGSSKTIDCYLYFRRTNSYSGTTWSSSVSGTVTIDGTSASASFSPSIPGYNNDWQGWYVHCSKTFEGDARNITISWSSSGVGSYFNGSGSATITVPASYTSPSTPSVALKSKTYNSATFAVSISSYGNPSGVSGRYIEAAVLQANSYDGSTSNARRWNIVQNTTSATILVNNSSYGNGGSSGEGLTIVGNHKYWYGGYATNTQKTASVVTGSFYTPCPPLSSLGDVQHNHKTYSLDSVVIGYTRADDGGAETRTGYYRYSTDGGTTYSAWTSFGTVSSTSDYLSATFPTSSTIILQVKLTTPNGGDSAIKSCYFSTLPTHVAPNFSNFEYEDTNEATLALTGDNSTMIQGQSIPLIRISSSDKATDNDDIPVSNYSITFTGQSKVISFSDSDIETTIGSPTDSGSCNLIVSAIDELSLSTSVSKTITVYPWAKPTLSASISRLNNFESESTISVSGTYSPIIINKEVKNELSVSFRYKKSQESDWSKWVALQVSLDGAKWVAKDYVVSLDNNYQWDVEVMVTDKFESVSSSLVLAVGMPNFFIGTDGRVSIGMKPEQYLPDENRGQLEVDGFVYSKSQPLMPSHVGQIIMTTTLDTSEKVSAIYGGYWEAWGEGRVPVGVGSNGTTSYSKSEQTGGSDKHTHQYGLQYGGWYRVTSLEDNSHAGILNYSEDGTISLSGGGTSVYSGSSPVNSNATTSVSSQTMAHYRMTGNAQFSDSRQPFITVYMWKRVE